NHSALWRPATVLPSRTFLIRLNHFRFEPQSDQLDHTTVRDPVSHAGQQLAVLDGIEIAFQVGIINGLIAVLQMPANLDQSRSEIVRRCRPPQQFYHSKPSASGTVRSGPSHRRTNLAAPRSAIRCRTQANRSPCSMVSK